MCRDFDEYWEENEKELLELGISYIIAEKIFNGERLDETGDMFYL